jgi:hypothetical protein
MHGSDVASPSTQMRKHYSWKTQRSKHSRRTQKQEALLMESTQGIYPHSGDSVVYVRRLAPKAPKAYHLHYQQESEIFASKQE